jgi:hypothetical protein
MKVPGAQFSQSARNDLDGHDRVEAAQGPYCEPSIEASCSAASGCGP